MRYLLVGLGNLGQKRLSLLGDRCVATVDPVNPAARYRSAEECPVSAYDAVLLSVPNDPKLGLVRGFLGLGKHVLVDKPLLLGQGDAEELAAISRRTGAIWYTSYNHRFEPMIERLREEVRRGAIGALYHARMVYANGTVQHVRGSWRDRGLGVVEDLGCHLLDLAGLILDVRGARFRAWTVRRHEAEAFDHAVLASSDGRIVLEASFLTWKNTFSIELFGERGSLHLRGLRKWGGSELVVRERVLPSGVPGERVETDAGQDCTWLADLAHFEQLCDRGETSLENDRWISAVLGGLV